MTESRSCNALLRSLCGDRRLIIILLLGFASGMPLALTASTLGIWLFESGIDIATIGILGSVAVAYNLKFLWAPLMDGGAVPLLGRALGRRRGWLIAVQFALMASIATLGIAGIFGDPLFIGLAALAVAFFSASQDIVIDAYRVELLPTEQQGMGAATIVLGYRIGMMASMAGALYLAALTDWPTTYGIMAALVAVGMLTVLFAPRPEVERTPLVRTDAHSLTQWFAEFVVAPFVDFMRREQWLMILSFIFFYKLGDAFLGLMPSVLYVQIGFSKEQIAGIVKVYGLGATILGGFAGGFMVARLGLMRSLWIGGIAQAAANVMFLALVQAGANPLMLTATVTAENFTGGVGTAAFVAYISSLASLRFTATQYALLSSLAALGRTLLSAPGGWLVKLAGWEIFFVFSVFLALPGLAILWWLGKITQKEPLSPL
jgi:PAT family beta-lactamase induction signal transducer AmpG